MTVDDGWTVPDAIAQFAQTGKPIDQLGKLLWCLPGFQPCGYSRPAPGGGRRYKRYSIGDLQRLHGFLAQNGWLDKPASGDTRPPSLDAGLLSFILGLGAVCLPPGHGSGMGASAPKSRTR